MSQIATMFWLATSERFSPPRPPTAMTPRFRRSEAGSFFASFRRASLSRRFRSRSLSWPRRLPEKGRAVPARSARRRNSRRSWVEDMGGLLESARRDMVTQSRITGQNDRVIAFLALLVTFAQPAPAEEPSRLAGPSGAAPAEAGIHWPSFRGPKASGISEGRPLPVRWKVESGEGIAWKTRIPGLAHSSPIIWGDRLFVTSAVGPADEPSLRVGLYGDIASVPDEGVHRFVVHCLDKASGRILWEKTVHTGVPRIKRHTKASHSNSTPATDGKRVVAFFGSEGLHVHDMEGNPIWKKDLGRLDSGFFRVPEAQWGFASSPVIHGDLAIVQCDVQGGGFI